MEIKSKIQLRVTKDIVDITYKDIDSTEELGSNKPQQVHAYCFYQGKLVIVYTPRKAIWTPPGGGIEPGETVEQAVVREVLEETNMKVLKQHLIGFQEIYEPGKVVIQTRSVCIVEPNGPFISDPDGDITEIKLIEPSDYKKYFDWGSIGDRLMERAMELKKEF